MSCEFLKVSANRSGDSILEMFDNSGKKVMECEAFIGRNGVTWDKKEGDLKTPCGVFELGIAFGSHDRWELELDESVQYVKLSSDLYWVDDVDSRFYNRLVRVCNEDNKKKNKEEKNLGRTYKSFEANFVNISESEIDWNSAEHLVDFPRQYEYAVEIKINPENIKGKGSAVFLHCSVGKDTAGCVAIDREEMRVVLKNLNKNAKIWIFIR